MERIPQEIRILIRHYVEQGEMKSDVARRFGVSRQSVYNCLRRKESENDPSRRASKLDEYKPYVVKRLEEFDIPATKLYREICERGFEGKITIVRDFVRSVKGEKRRKLTERFETEPGRQAQVDWGECGTVIVDGQRRKLYVFVLVLGYSRMLFARFTTSTKQHVLHRCLQEAFSVLGVPREVLVDNMRQAVERHTGDRVQFNKAFLDFCEHYGVVPRATPPYWPRAKGKVERGVGYIKNSFLPGCSFTDIEDLNGQLDGWINSVASVRIHGTTREQPIVRYATEEPILRRFASFPWLDTRAGETRSVASDSHISYMGVRYSVDPVAVRRTVVVKASGEQLGAVLEISVDGRLVGIHRRVAGGSSAQTLPEHREAIRRVNRNRHTGSAAKARYVQLPSPEKAKMPDVEVQTRDLDLYERLLAEASR